MEFKGSNPTQLYMDALGSLMTEGEQVAPRGKPINELHPALFKFTNPLNRVTYLKGRVINPFFQLAESFWIVAGRADVDWLKDYNASIAQFSDDGVHFNAPYGERLRSWNRHSLSDTTELWGEYDNVLDTVDQLKDVVRKIQADTDTRQAVAIIYNPLFDNANNDTKDTPCNIALMFKIRNGKLDLTLANRSNDIHWGTFGANLCQFTTIQEMVATWLGVPVGVYNHFTDSLHVYLQDYGYKETGKIADAYGITDWTLSLPTVNEWEFPDEPRMVSDMRDTDNILAYYFTNLDHLYRSSETYTIKPAVYRLAHEAELCPDPYWRTTLLAMLAYQCHKRGMYDGMLNALERMPDCSWKVSCLRFLVKRYEANNDVYYGFKMLYQHLDGDIQDYIERKGE